MPLHFERKDVVPSSNGVCGGIVRPGPDGREGESQEVRGTSQPAWESGHGERGRGNITFWRSRE